GGTHAVDAATGQQLWVGPGGGFTSAVVAEGRVYVGGRTLIALNARTGARVWTNTDRVSFFTPAVSDGVVYVGSDGGAFAVDAATGVTLWHHEDQVAFDTATPAVGGGLAYFEGYDGTNGKVEAFDLATG